MATISLVEIIWTGMAIMGCLAALWGILDSWLDLRAQRRQGVNGAMRLTTLGNLRRDLFRLGEHLIFLALGVLALLAPPGAGAVTSDMQAWALATFRAAFVPGLVVAVFSIVLNTIGDRADRIRLRDYLYQQDRLARYAALGLEPKEEGH